MSFQWHTDADERWEEPVTGPRRALPRRLLLSLLLLALALALGGYRVIASRAEAALEQARTDVLQTHRLLAEAVAAGDDELVATLVSGPEPAWRQALAGRSLYQPPFMELLARPLPGPPRARLMPDLQSATVTQVVTFTLSGNPATLSDTVQLQRRFDYRRANEGWQWAPAGGDEAVWGAWITDRRPSLLFVYREQDASLARRLGPALESRVDEICEWLGGCAAAMRVQLRFTPELIESVLAHPATGLLSLDLPTPSLLGQPLDQKGERLLLHYYTTHLALALADHLINQEWIGYDAYTTELQRALLARFPLTAWPSQPPGPPEFSSAPRNDLLALCAGPVAEGASVYRYDMNGGTWREELSDLPLVSMVPIPGGVAFQKKEIRRIDDEPSVLLWRADRPLVTLERKNLSSVDERGGRTVLYVQSDGQQLAYDLEALAACESADCALPAFRKNFPVWSPDGRHVLFYEPRTGEILISSSPGQAARVIAVGQSPFWLDNEHFGYVADGLFLARAEDGVTRLALSLQDVEALLADAGRPGFFYLNQPLGHPAHPDQLFLSVIQPSGRTADLLLLAYHLESGALEILGTLAGTWPAALQFSPDGRWLTLYSGSSGERGRLFLYDLASAAGERLRQLAVHAGPASPLPAYSWTTDGRWLVAAHGGRLRLIAPAEDEIHDLTPPVPGCAFAAWIPQR